MGRVVVMDQAGWAADRVRRSLAPDGTEVIRVVDEGGASGALRKRTSLLVLNLCLQPSASLASVEEVVHEADGTPLLVLTGCAPLEEAAHRLFPDAADVLRLPLSDGEFRRRLMAAPGKSTVRGEKPPPFGQVIGRAPAMAQVYRKGFRAARSDSTLLLTGETGTGKGLVARTIHDVSDRRDRPFLVVSCAELSESLVESELFGHVRGSFTGATQNKPGLFEVAGRGTVLIDEVGDASPTVQARLLRVVEEKEIRRVGDVRTRPVTARIIVSTHVNLEERVRTGRFREDLFFRLKILQMHLPPLRERKEDIALLVDHYFSNRRPPEARACRCTPLALEILESHSWPGNVRELFAVLEGAVTGTTGRSVEASDLPEELRSDWTRATEGDEAVSMIRKALRETGGHRGRAAEVLGFSRTTLWRRMKDLGITC